jgi:dipeptidyl aminopeptidase/acylaminoacyl peptidase
MVATAFRCAVSVGFLVALLAVSQDRSVASEVRSGRLAVIAGTPPRLATMDASGSRRRLVRVAGKVPRCVAWTPSGRRLLAWRSPRRGQLVGGKPTPFTLLDTQGHRRGVLRIPPFAGWRLPASCPTWSRDGRRLAFVRPGGDGGAGSAVFVVSRRGRGQRILASPPVPVDGLARFSPDGTRVIFPGSGSLFTVPVAGGAAQEIRPNPQIPAPAVPSVATILRSAEYSPDGRSIAAGSDAGVVVMNTDGSEAHVIAPGADAIWSPDGTRIASIDSGGQLLTFKPDGTDQRLIARHVSFVDWQAAR